MMRRMCSVGNTAPADTVKRERAGLLSRTCTALSSRSAWPSTCGGVLVVEPVRGAEAEGARLAVLPGHRAHVADDAAARLRLHVGDLAEVEPVALAGVAGEIVEDAAGHRVDAAGAARLHQREIVDRPVRRQEHLRRHAGTAAGAGAAAAGTARASASSGREPFAGAERVMRAFLGASSASAGGPAPSRKMQDVGKIEAGTPIAQPRLRAAGDRPRRAPTVSQQGGPPWPERSNRRSPSSASCCRRRRSPVANYVPFVRTGNLLVVSGQTLFRRRRQARGQGPARRRGLDRGRPEGGARLRHQRAGPAQGRARRSRQGGARGAARRLHQFGARLHRRCRR